MSQATPYIDKMRIVEGEPLAEKAVLPTSAYISESFYKQEVDTIFNQSWLFGCYAHELAKPGDALPVEIVGQPVILLRNSTGDLRAFHNVCSHRGTKILCEPKENRKSLVCPYHSWIYDTDGALIRSRHFAGVDRAELPDLPATEVGLKSLAVEEWLDFIFVNFDTSARPFAELIAPLDERWQDYELTAMRYGASLRYDFQANWKLVVENFLESYHVPFIHQTLNTYSPFTERYQLRLSENVLGIGQGLYAPDHESEESLPRWPTKSGKTPLTAEYFSIFPNFLIGVMPDHLFAWHLDPQATNRTIEHLAFYFVDDKALEPRFEAQRKATLEDWKLVNDEDWDIVQRIYEGCSSSAFSRAVLSRHMERNIKNFQRLVINRIGDNS